MAAITKQLYFTNTSNVTESAIIYDTVTDVGNVYMHISINGQICYVPLVSLDNPYATSARVVKNGITYAIGKAVVPEYGYEVFTANGATSGSVTKTFIPDINVYRVKVTAVGGGAGGVTGYVPSGTQTVTFNTAGGTTSFGNLVTAAGGTSPSVVVSNGSVTSNTVSKGTNNGTYHYGSTDLHSGRGNISVTTTSGVSVNLYGRGGYCDENNGGRVNFTGANGFKVIQYANVTPGVPITITIGAAGKTWHRGSLDYSTDNTLGYGFQPGVTGGLLVEWGEGVV